MFAVATIGEALELREAGIKLPVMILGYTSPEYAEIISKYDIGTASTDLLPVWVNTIVRIPTEGKCISTL